VNKADNIFRNKLTEYESQYSATVFDGVLVGINQDEDNRRFLIWRWLGLSVFVLSLIFYFLFINQNSLAEIKESEPQTVQHLSPQKSIISPINKELNTPLNPTLILIPENKRGGVAIPFKKEEATNDLQIEVRKDKRKSELFVDAKRKIENEKQIVNAVPISSQSKSTIVEEVDVKIDEKRSPYKVDLLAINFNSVESGTPMQLKEPIGCPIFGGKVRSPIFIEAYISHDMPLRTLSQAANATEPQGAYIDLRDESESATYSFHTGVRLSSNLFRNFVARLGVDYAQITEKFKVTQLESSREVIIRDADGNIISTTIEQGLRDVVNYNKFKSYNIPVSIGWQNRIGKLGFNVHGGVAFSMVSSHSGIIFEPNQMPMPVAVTIGEGGDQAVFKNDLGLSAIGSIGIAYPLGERIDFLIEPNMKYILNPINLTSYPVEQRMFTIGLLTGFRYKF